MGLIKSVQVLFIIYVVPVVVDDAKHFLSTL